MWTKSHELGRDEKAGKIYQLKDLGNRMDYVVVVQDRECSENEVPSEKWGGIKLGEKSLSELVREMRARLRSAN